MRPSRIFLVLLIAAAIVAIIYKRGGFRKEAEVIRQGCQQAMGRHGSGAVKACIRARRINRHGAEA